VAACGRVPGAVSRVARRVSLTHDALAQAAPTSGNGNLPVRGDPALTQGATVTFPSQLAPNVAGITCQAAIPGQFRNCVYQDGFGATLTFYLYLPDGYNPTQKYPLVLMLHGGGERAIAQKTAAQNRAKLLDTPYAAVWGPGANVPYSPAVQKRWPSFVVVPQLLYPDRWVDVNPHQGSYVQAADPTPSLYMAKAIVDELRAKYASVDPTRLYITGMSLGGYGTWDAIERWPTYFAAAGPICGAGDPALASKLVHLPIWAFAGSADPIVPVSGSRTMIAAIRKDGGHPLYTEYPGVGHVSWIYPYAVDGQRTASTAFYSWLFSQHRATAVPSR
ncbi:MAG TPA: dienelactone hydrolase family protein, partial [Thermomicrobiaceae bacterium]|nr:dienelactone hydrolase family protein [Thermomicrobiaceae bacterium]